MYNFNKNIYHRNLLEKLKNFYLFSNVRKIFPINMSKKKINNSLKYNDQKY